MRLRFRVFLLAVACLALSGCGGGSDVSYKSGTLEACFRQGGEAIIRFGSMPAAERRLFEAHLPGGFGVRFLAGELALFYVAKSGAAAKSAQSWLLDTRSRNHASSASVETSVSGDLFELISAPPSLGTRDEIASCLAAAHR